MKLFISLTFALSLWPNSRVICFNSHSSLSNRKLMHKLSAKDSFFNQATSDVIKRNENSALDSKAHINKYKTFSKNLQDPLLVKLAAVSKSESNVPSNVLSSNKNTNKETTSRGTTVPVSTSRIKVETPTNSPTLSSVQKSKAKPDIKINSSSILRKTNTSTPQPPQTYKLNKAVNSKKYLNSIQPSDPFTFGYVEIGCILNPHGVKGEIKLQASVDDVMINDLNLIKGSTVYLRKPNRRTPRPIQLNTIRKQNNNIYLLLFDQIDAREMAEGLKGYQLYIRKADRPTLSDDEYMIRDLVGMKCYLYYNTTSDSSSSTNGMSGNKKLKQGETRQLNQQQQSVATINEKDIAVDLDADALMLQQCVNGRQPVGVIEGVVPPDELCSPDLAKLMHSLLELRLFPPSSHHNNDNNSNDDSNSNNNGVLCLIPLVPQIVKLIDRNRKLIVFDPPIGLLDLTYIEKKKYIIRGFLPAHVESLSKELRTELEMATVLVASLPPFMMSSKSSDDDEDED